MEKERPTVGMIGLGLMGTAMSTRLLAAGCRVVGFDLDPGARERHARRGGDAVDTLAAVAAECQAVLLSLPNGEVTLEVCFGEGGLEATAPKDTVVVDTSTVRPEQAIAAGKGLAAAGLAFHDAGVSGTSAMVARGESLGVVGGDAGTYPLVEQVLGTICREVRHVGSVGDGMRAKLVINGVLSVNRFALAEGLVLAEKMGIDSQKMLDVLQASAAYSKAMDMWGQRMVDREYVPPHSRVLQHSKDGNLILGLGRQYGAPMLALSQVEHVVNTAIANGFGDADNACIVEMLRMLAGIKIEPWSPESQGSED